MNKTNKYYLEIQNIAKKHTSYVGYIKEIDNFLNTQNIIKNNKIKTLADKIKIFWIEYVNHNLKADYNNQIEEKDILKYLYNKINYCCLDLKTISTNEIYICVVSSKKDKINQIIDNRYDNKIKEIKLLESKIKELKKGMV